MLGQTIKPARWVIVNDGSTDETGRIAAEAAAAHSWIKLIHRTDRGFRKAGGGVIEAFYDGYRLIKDEPWEFLAKLDGDLSFDPDYFEKCLEAFHKNPTLGIGGGTICSDVDGTVEAESKVDPKFHVRGAVKIYRQKCWTEINGLIRAPGWDTLDEVRANMLGWATLTFSELSVIHHRPAGVAYGVLRDRVKGGIGHYVAGYHPLFMFCKCVKRIKERPYFLGACGLWFGFLKGYVKRVPRVEDQALIKYFHQQQLNRLLGRKSLWS
jgi:glycosyltransferase involved in cell wall biosynthesis